MDTPINFSNAIFLDIDGVLNFSELRDRRGNSVISRECVHNLVAILRASDAKIIVSSTWRITGIDNFKREFAKCMQQAGVADSLIEFIINSIVDITLDFDCLNRGREIQEWLDSHEFKGRFAILDDDLDLFIGSDFGGSMFVTFDEGMGLTVAIAERVIDWLK